MQYLTITTWPTTPGSSPFHLHILVRDPAPAGDGEYGHALHLDVALEA